ncbi:hypothetical protein [Vibrio phage vB_VpS_PG28]|nr:hypothetical protein [Vibrio phage vB_VpS_PG28]
MATHVIPDNDLVDGAMYVVWDNSDHAMTVAQYHAGYKSQDEHWGILNYPTEVPFETFSPVYEIMHPEDFEDKTPEEAIATFWNQMREKHG